MEEPIRKTRIKKGTGVYCVGEENGKWIIQIGVVIRSYAGESPRSKFDYAIDFGTKGVEPYYGWGVFTDKKRCEEYLELLIKVRPNPNVSGSDFQPKEEPKNEANN